MCTFIWFSKTKPLFNFFVVLIKQEDSKHLISNIALLLLPKHQLALKYTYICMYVFIGRDVFHICVHSTLNEGFFNVQ
jgi:hypothetical protein